MVGLLGVENSEMGQQFPTRSPAATQRTHRGLLSACRLRFPAAASRYRRPAERI